MMKAAKISRRTFVARAAAASAAVSSPAWAAPKTPDVLPVVYYAPEVTAAALIRLYERLQTDFQGRVGIKIHGGEARVNLNLFKALQQHIKDSGFVETNWASDFSGDRAHTASHIEVIRSQGVDFAPVDVLDREGAVRSVPVAAGHELKTVDVCEAMMTDYAGIVVLTNFKVPSFAGYTGSVKNIGIGLVSADAKCVVHGPGYLKSREFFDRLADAAKGVSEAMGKKLVSINIVKDLTPEPVAGVKARSGTLGMTASFDMTACDQAAVDLIYGLTPAQYDAWPEDTKIRTGVYQLESLAAIGAGSRRYRLVKI